MATIPDQSLEDLPEESKIWKKRWDELNNTLLFLAGYYQSSTVNSPDKENFDQLFRYLSAFAKKQFEFFFNGFQESSFLPSNGGTTPRLQESVEMPPGYVYTAVLDQISTDLDVIQRAANQRLVVSQSRTDSERIIFNTLETARKLAQQALEPAVEGEKKLLGNGMPTVITYFQKSSAIRVVPYAPVALIGIPLSPMSVYRDNLSVPHEVGHYVYWHGKTEKGEPIYRYINRIATEQAMENPEQVQQWVEEIFADVYGCMVGGSVIALSSQDLAYQRSSIGFINDDEEHPTPALRPYIYTKGLDLLGQQIQPNNLQLTSSNLNKRWVQKLSERGVSTANYTTLIEDVNILVEKIFVFLLQYGFVEFERWSDDLVEYASSEDEGNIESVYQQFEQKVVDLESEIVKPELLRDLTEMELQNLWDKWINDEQFLNSSSDPIRPGNLEDLKLSEEPDGYWVHVLHAAGWTSRIRNHNSP